MALIQEGKYEGVTVAASIYEAPSGAVMCSMVVDVAGAHLKGGICLVQKDGTLSERGFKDVQAIFGWSDWDWSKWSQEPETFAGAAVQAVVETIQGERGEFSSIKHINPTGGGQRLEKADAKGLAAKYGAKTRARFGGVPSAPFDAAQGRPATRTPSPQPSPLNGEGERRTPPPPPSVPPLDVPPSSMEVCWDAFCRENPDQNERDLYKLWAEYVKTVAGKLQNVCTPADWGLVLYRLNAGMLPL